MRDRWTSRQPFLVGGAVGPRGDGYVVDTSMTADDAAAYHAFQLDCLARTPADVANAMTISYVDEAVGIARAAQGAGLPVVIGFTVETDGRLPSGTLLADAIGTTDDVTGGYPLHYMVNCAHPSHFVDALDGESWLGRLRAVRANASAKSHAELDEATELDAGDPTELAERYVELADRLPGLQVVGGCCGTDHRHVEAITAALVEARRAGSARPPGN